MSSTQRPSPPRKATEQQPARHAKAESKPDERIGLPVADKRWTEISFEDGRQYRCEDGIIVERTRSDG